jgi:hypothetical protein
VTFADPVIEVTFIVGLAAWVVIMVGYIRARRAVHRDPPEDPPSRTHA